MRPGPVTIVAAGALVGGASVAAMRIWPDHHGCLNAAYYALNVYAVLGPALVLAARRFWVEAAAATVMGVVLFFGLLTIGPRIAGTSGFGENALIFLLPLFLFPAAMLLVSIVRLALWLVVRRRSGQLSAGTASV